jgi:hypothetical protein
MRRTSSLVGGLLAIFLLVGCGGGGGSSESPYTGVTTPAVIDNTNAVEIVLGAYYGGEMMDTSFLPVVLGVKGSGSAAPPPLNVVALVRTLKDVTDSIVGQSQATKMVGQARPLTVWSDSGRIPEGAIDNYVEYSLSWNDQTGAISLVFSFHNYGDGEGGVLNGSINVTGTTSIDYNPDPQPGEPELLPGEFLEITIGFSSFISTDGITTVKISGSMTLENDVTGNGSAILNLYVTDEATGKTSRIENYAVNVTVGTDGTGAYTDVTISAGSICLHDHGCVGVVTNVPFRTYDAYPFPSSGVLVVTGGEGRSARLIVIDESTGYFVEADLDGNGTYEWVSIDYPWV